MGLNFATPQERKGPVMPGHSGHVVQTRFQTWLEGRCWLFSWLCICKEYLYGMG